MYVVIHVGENAREITATEVERIGFTYLMGILQKGIDLGVIDRFEVISDAE